MIENYASPKFYNKFVEEVNTSLSGLSWLENIYPVARTGVDDQGTFPEVYRNGGEKKSERIFPHGNSISFFTVENYTQIDFFDTYEVNMSLYVWADLTKSTGKDYDYTIELVNDVTQILESHSAYSFNIDEGDPFADFSQLDKIINQNTMRPYSAFRIDFIVNLLICS